MAIEEVGVRLVAESEKQFQTAMKNADNAVKGFGKTTTNTSDQIQDSTKKMSTFGKGMEMLKPMVTGLIAMFAFDKVKDFFVGAVKAASDLNETLNKSAVVFGDYAGDIEQMGSKAAETMGMSKNEAVAAAATYGNLFTAMKMGKKPAAEMSVGLVQLAADLGSFNNLPTAEVLEKIRAGLVGEGEPLKALGIIINETTLKQEAMNMGLSDGKAPLDAVIKAQAAYSLMLKQSTNAQGDFARTADGAANSTKILEAQTADLTAEIGKGLLPAWVGILKTLNDAIKTFNLLRTKGEQLDDVVRTHEQEIHKTYKTYGEYLAEMKRVIALANGFKNFQEYTGYMRAHGLSIQDVYEKYGIADRLGWEYYQMVGKGTVKVEANADATLRLANSQETYLKYIQADDVKRQEMWNDAMKAAAYQAGLADQALSGFTAAVILNMMGLEKGSEAWWNMALRLGVVTQKEKDTADAIKLWDKALQDHKITREQYIEGLGLIAAGLNAIPPMVETTIEYRESFTSDWLKNNLYTWGIGNKTFTQTTTFQSTGGPGESHAQPTTPTKSTSTSKSKAKATGGPVMAGWPYMVGERGPEPFIPAMNGYILSKADAERIYASQVAASLPAAMVSAGPSSYSYSNANNYNLSVLTSQSPQVVQRSFAIMKLLAG